METEVPDVIDEAAIKRVMEDVGLRSVDLNSEASEPADDMASACENSSALSPGEDIPQPKINGIDDSQHDDEEQGCIAEETDGDSGDDDEEDEMPELGDSDGALVQTDTGNDGKGDQDSSEDEEALPRLSSRISTQGKEDAKTPDNLSSEVGSGHLEDDLLGNSEKGDQNQK